MYYTGTPLYPFGHGLSYTEFKLTFAPGSTPATTTVQLDNLAAGFAATNYDVTVTNTGMVAGKETVMLFCAVRVF
jgi:beta-glucosidase